jgi:tRNA nucleotidyltransferase/poly(A) polymerase
MPDYIYLLENRLSADQQHALRQLREAAREAEMILFLTGDAVRDLTSGHAVRDLEVAVHGNALKLKKSLEHLGAAIWGESESSKSLYVCFPGTVRVDVVSTHRLDFAKIDKPVRHAASIQEDLRRRDFTVNAMAISLNEGSFGLLMDPLNGAADIETRSLRLVSNYGFLEEPSLLIRATRYMARLGWELDPKTQTRYANAKEEGVIERLSAEALSRELEQIGHEEEGLKVLRALDAEGWMKVLFAPWTAAKADEERLKALHDLAVELLVQGVHPDMSAAQMQLLTAKLNPKDLASLKKLMLRPGFVEEWDSLDTQAAKFAKVLLSKENSIPSASFKLFTSYDPEAVLWLGFTSKDKAVLERYRQFQKEWPEARQRIPHALMQEMRITPELAAYKEIVQAIFLELIDGKLTTTEEMRAFLEPHSPPAPPPQVTVKRPRAKRGEAKVKERSYDEDEESEDDLDDEDEDLDDLGGDDDEIDLSMNLPKADIEPEGDELDAEGAEDESDEDDSDDTPPEPPPAKRGAKGAAPSKAKATHGKSDAISAKAPAPSPKATAVPAAVPAKPSATAPGSRKEATMSDSPAVIPAIDDVPRGPGVKPPQLVKAPGVKPPQSLSANTVSAPGVKPPQTSTAKALTAKTISGPGVKPPQATKGPVAKAAILRGPGVKPPQATKSKAIAAAAKPKAAVKPAKPVKAAAKAAPAKGKPAAKAVAKPVKKAAKPAAKAGKKR